MSDDSCDELPLPPSTSPPRRLRNSSGDTAGSDDSEIASIPPPPARDSLDEIPYPMEPVGEEMDMEIPLPADSSRYSPSHVLGGEDEEDISSPSDRKKSVLGKAQAKKRLLAFSAAKAAANILSPSSTTSSVNSAMVKKLSPMKPPGPKQKSEPVLAIHSIKEEETKLKEMLAMNSLLADKLKQVKNIAESVPKIQLMPTTSPDSPKQQQIGVVRPFTEGNTSENTKNEKRKKSKRRQSISISPISSKSRSPSVEMRKSCKKSRSKKSRSPSPMKRNEEKEKNSHKKETRRSRSPKKEERKRSPIVKQEVKKSSKSSRMSPPPPKASVKRENRSREKDGYSQDRHSSRESQEKKDWQGHGQGDRERRSEGNEKNKTSRRRHESDSKTDIKPLLPQIPPRSTKYEKIRKSRMPLDWSEYKKCDYITSDIVTLWKDLKDKDRGIKKMSESSPLSHGIECPTKLSKTLGILAKNPTSISLVNGNHGDYPEHLVHWTRHYPRIQYGFKPLSIKGYYKTRRDIFNCEESEIICGMSRIIDLQTSSIDKSKSLPSDKRDWWASSEQVFCPSQGSKNVLISHLYSEDEESKSPFPVKKDETPESPFPVKKDEVEERDVGKIISEGGGGGGDSESEEGSNDSAPSPLLKRKYEKIFTLDSSSKSKLKEIKEEKVKPIVQVQVPIVIGKIESEEDSIGTKVKTKKIKKDKKIKREMRKRETTSSEDDDNEEETDLKRKRRKGKRKNRKREKSSSGEDEEDPKFEKVKKKKSKKEKKSKYTEKGKIRRRDKSPDSSSDDNGKPFGTNRSGFESHRDQREGNDKSNHGNRKEGHHHRKHTSGSGSGHHRRHPQFLIDPAELGNSDMDWETWGVLAEAEALKEFVKKDDEGVEFEAETQEVLSSLQDDEFLQFVLDNENLSSAELFQLSTEGPPLSFDEGNRIREIIVKEDEKIKIEEITEIISTTTTTTLPERIIVEEKGEIIKEEKKIEKVEETVKEIREKRSSSRRSDEENCYPSRRRRYEEKYYHSRRRHGSDEKYYSTSSRWHRESDDEHYYYSSRHHRRNHDDSDEEKYYTSSRRRYGRYGERRLNDEIRSYEKSKYKSNKKFLSKSKISPPLQLNIADSTISDADLVSGSPKSKISPPISLHVPVTLNLQPVASGPGYIGGISKEVLLDVSATHFHPDNFHQNQNLVQNLVQNSHIQQGRKGSSGYGSPPRRLSLDERLEMEMGIKLREEVPKPIEVHPYYTQHHHSYFHNLGPGQAHEQVYPYQQASNYVNSHQIRPQNHHYCNPPSSYGQQYRFPALHQPPFQRPRLQSQIIQVGNMIQVVPAEIPTAPITITSTLVGEPINDVHYQKPAVGNREQGMGQKRVVRIKIPVVPFTLPMMTPHNGPSQAEIDEQRLIRRKRRAQRQKQRQEERKAAEGKSSGTLNTNTMKKGEVKKMESAEDEISAEELALLKEAMSEVPNFEDNLEDEMSKEQEKPMETDEIEEDSEEAQITLNVENETELIEETLVIGCEREEVLEVEPIVEVKIEKKVIKPVPILPRPDVGILVPFGLRDRQGEKKSVKFADGINPGFGGEDSGGEEIASPPPPASYPYKKSFTKEKTNPEVKKKKIKVKVKRKKSIDENIEPPGPPRIPYPFCPIGILYQVCPQYAVLYAQTMAEKGIDIIFEPSTQQPSYGKTDCVSVPVPGMRPSETTHPSSFEDSGHSSTELNSDSNSSVSKIPTIMSMSRESREDMMELEEIELPRSPLLDDIPLPAENPNLLVISPTKIPLPQEIPKPKKNQSKSALLDQIPLPDDKKKEKHDKKSEPEVPHDKSMEVISIGVKKQSVESDIIGRKKSMTNISIPLARIAAEKRVIINQTRSTGLLEKRSKSNKNNCINHKINSLPLRLRPSSSSHPQHPPANLCHEFKYDFKPLPCLQSSTILTSLRLPIGLDLSRPPPSFTQLPLGLETYEPDSEVELGGSSSSPSSSPYFPSSTNNILIVPAETTPPPPGTSP